jgi:hypothetical protein
LVAGREKDIDFLNGLFRHGLVRVPVIIGRLAQSALPADRLANLQGAAGPVGQNYKKIKTGPDFAPALMSILTICFTAIPQDF